MLLVGCWRDGREVNGPTVAGWCSGFIGGTSLRG
jgi:hypothetical protein